MRSALGLLSSLLLILCAAARAEAGPRVGSSTGAAVVFSVVAAENLFPAGVRFEAEAQAAGEIVAATVEYRVEGEPVTYRAAVTPGSHARLVYYWDTRPQGVPPNATITYQWQVTTADGARAASAAQSLAYTDVRYAWQVLAGDRAEVWWHEGSPELAARVLSIAGQAIEHQDRVFQDRLAGRPRLILYNSHEEFAAWQPDVPAFVDGEAFPAQNLTVQVIGSEQVGDWPSAVIPHELSRLGFTQAAGYRAPEWLDEGFALYNEFVEHPAEDQALQAAILRQDLAPLADLRPALASSDRQRVRIAQAEALSAVRYLMYQYGPEHVVDLLHAFRDGRPIDEAFQAVLGLPPDRVEENWQVWLGVPEAWRAAAHARATAAAGGAEPATPHPIAAFTPAAPEAQPVKADGKATDPGERALAVGGVAALAVFGPLATILLVGSLRARKGRG